MDVLLFLAFTFFCSWTGAFTYFALGGSAGADSYPLVVAIFMLWPGIAAALVEGGFSRRILRELGLVFQWNRWVLAGWLLPPLLVLATAAFGPSLSGGEWSVAPGHPANPLLSVVVPGGGGVLGDLGLTSATALLLLVLIAGMLAGATINLVLGLSQELGWRGFLHRRLRPLGFWPMSWLTGMIWGAWHLPLLLYGPLYPGAPGLALLMILPFTLLLSPILFFLHEKAGTVLAPALLHGTLSALGVFSLFVEGEGAFWVGPAGIVALTFLAAFNVAIFWWRRRERVIAI